MSKEKRAAWVVFKMDKKMSTDEWRERFSGAYEVMSNLPGIFFKCWWVNQEKNEWGALYVFDSLEQLNDYLKSDLWVNKVPEKYGFTPQVTILEPGPIICKKAIGTAKNSWLS